MAVPFAAWQTEPKDRLLHDEVYGQRQRVLKDLLAADRPPPLVAAAIPALLQPTPERERLENASRRLHVGQTIAIEELCQWLADCGFNAANTVEMPGEFSRRGGLLDVFASDWLQPVRIEFFDDEIESLRRFDAASQRSVETMSAVEITVLKAAVVDRGHFADYLPAGSAALLVDPSKQKEEAQQYLSRLQQPERLHTWQAVMQSVAAFPVISAAGLGEAGLGETYQVEAESVERFSGDLEKVREELDAAAGEQDVFMVAVNRAESERVGELLQASQTASAGRLHFVEGELSQGFRLFGKPGAIVISSDELFQRHHLRRGPSKHLGKSIDSFLDLRSGDLVVHLTHGIGRYRGLQLLDKDGRVEEHLQIEFGGKTKIYVPAAKIGLVQKYIGGTKSQPKLAKIGGKTWVRQKQAAQAAVIDPEKS